MVNIKRYVSEFIEAAELTKDDTAKIRIEPYFDETSKYESLIAEVDFKGEHRKLNINKGNAKFRCLLSLQLEHLFSFFICFLFS